MLYKVAESEASGSASIANEYVRPLESDLPAGDQPGRAAGGTDADTPPKGDARSPKAAADNETFKKVADSILVDSFDVAKKIDRLIWKYRAMVRIALWPPTPSSIRAVLSSHEGSGMVKPGRKPCCCSPKLSPGNYQNEARPPPMRKPLEPLPRFSRTGYAACWPASSLIARSPPVDTRMLAAVSCSIRSNLNSWLPWERSPKHKDAAGRQSRRDGGSAARFARNFGPLCTGTSRPACSGPSSKTAARISDSASVSMTGVPRSSPRACFVHQSTVFATHNAFRENGSTAAQAGKKAA